MIGRSLGWFLLMVLLWWFLTEARCALRLHSNHDWTQCRDCGRWLSGSSR
jgi:hypothetical protein